MPFSGILPLVSGNSIFLLLKTCVRKPSFTSSEFFAMHRILLKKTVISKLNPLQRLVYLGLKVLIIPVMVVSGLLYMFYHYPQDGGIEMINVDNLEIIALIHTFGAFVVMAFVIVHLYLITTGHTITSNLKAMITGWEELEVDENENKNKETDENKK